MLFDRFSVVPSILENYSRDSVPNGLWPVYLLEWSFAILLRILPRKWPRDRDEDDSNSKADYNQENTKANNRLKFLNWESLTSRNMTPSVDNRKRKKRNDIAVWSPRRWDPNYRKGGRAAAENSVNRKNNGITAWSTAWRRAEKKEPVAFVHDRRYHTWGGGPGPWRDATMYITRCRINWRMYQ